MRFGCRPTGMSRTRSDTCSSGPSGDLRVRRDATMPVSVITQSWKKRRRVVVKIEWHSSELCTRVGFVITDLARPAERIVAFHNQRGTAEQWNKEGKEATKWTRLSCRSFAALAIRLQLHALAYNLGNFMRTLAMP